MPKKAALATKRRHYTEAQKAEALAKYKAAGGNLERAAREAGVPRKTLERWVKEPERAAPAQVRQEKDAELDALINTAIKAVVRRIPNAEGNVQQLATAAAILADKRRHLNGEQEPTGEIGGGVRVEIVWPSYGEDGKVIPFRRAA